MVGVWKEAKFGFGYIVWYADVGEKFKVKDKVECCSNKDNYCT